MKPGIEVWYGEDHGISMTYNVTCGEAGCFCYRPVLIGPKRMTAQQARELAAELERCARYAERDAEAASV